MAVLLHSYPPAPTMSFPPEDNLTERVAETLKKAGRRPPAASSSSSSSSSSSAIELVLPPCPPEDTTPLFSHQEPGLTLTPVHHTAASSSPLTIIPTPTATQNGGDSFNYTQAELAAAVAAFGGQRPLQLPPAAMPPMYQFPTTMTPVPPAIRAPPAKKKAKKKKV